MKRTQSKRALILLIYILILFGFNYLAFNSWLPAKDFKGLWFYSGIASILLGNLLVTPFYTKPVDAISYSVVGLITIFLVNDWLNWVLIDKAIYITALSFQGIVILVSFIGIITKDSDKTIGIQISKTCMIFSEFLGNQRIVFSVVILYAIIVFHRTEVLEMFFITLAWVITVVIEPDKHLFKIIERISNVWKVKQIRGNLGFISAYQLPKMILINQPEDSFTEFGTTIIYKDSHDSIKTGITLNYVGRNEQLLLRAIEFESTTDAIEVAKESAKIFSSNSVAQFEYYDKNPDEKDKVSILKNIDDLIGIVDEQTSVEKLCFEVIDNNDIEEGRLVEVEINGQTVLYQILDGLTKEDIVIHKNKYGYARATATKIGIWNAKERKFSPAKWLPEINTPVFLKKTIDYTPSFDTIGHFPKTNYTVGIENVNELVTHNTAILGILGIGKSMLSIELVERMIAEKIRVICIDLTDQYADKLSDYYDAETESEIIEEIANLGKTGKTTVRKNVEEGGSINELRNAIKNDLKDFFSDINMSYLKIYNPAKFEAWKQDSKPYQGDASMMSLTPTEITQIISESALEICQEQGMTENARCCLVYEEAHSLIPEWNSVASEGDKAATNGTARAILQGRKYGLGCMLITQRTANVTKTILNQCNSIFAMRTFDDTGKNFISNYIGSEYSDKLSSLKERQAVFYGKASTCENPVLIRLNDRDDFTKVFREKYLPPELPTNEVVENEEIKNKKDTKKETDDFNDLPF
ncbi:MAG: DUF87 domain-containing protein [Bacteroidetes bacterium]|nr:DUF87 domain-containing protein [Bacteroidota bacterium]